MQVDDFTGNSIDIGDYVALSEQNNTSIIYGTIIKISIGKSGKLSVAIEVDGPFKTKRTLYRVPHNIIKIGKDLVAEKILLKRK